MKAGVIAVAAAMAAGASAGHAGRRHAHEALHVERGLLLTTGKAAEPTCGCTTIYTTITGEGTLIFPSSTPTYAANTTTASSTSIYVPPTTSSTSTPPPTSSTCPPATVPTPLATTCSTTGVYTIPATTVTITESTTVCAATGTKIPSGTHTAGGVTTTVTGSTTVTCPYASTGTSEGVVTSTILTTTYVCPSAGTYTIAPLTTTCETETFWVYPTPASYAPGTYTQAEVVTTITETDYVVFCPYTSPAPVKPSTTYAPAPVYTTSAAPKATTSKSSSSGGSSGGQLGTSGNQWAITYSPYENSGACKAAGDVMSDIKIIAGKGFSSVRVYSTDCSGLVNIGAACEAYGLKMIIGIFISETGISGASDQVSEIVSWGKWELVELIAIGNECVFSGYATASELASFISSCKSTFSSAGYSGPCTTTEPLNIWQENVDVLCEVVDVVGCNIHPFFNGDITASEAGSFVASQLAIVDKLCSGKYGVNLETGWPSFGTCNGVACPGTSEQATAVKAISDAAGGKSVMFSYTDDYWKEPGAFGCEQSWGAIQLFG
ncbi:related beta-glucosidase btgE [Phialocephala subalpina]|uniref:Probable beta-glucosidase btgE n=1 Tax=Phialocephala subalpina TaxID=576137 RepID=A0A1L7WDV0_9HELO|nr:related beta-glucosidase btgE [Phialocephala subalpina]